MIKFIQLNEGARAESEMREGVSFMESFTAFVKLKRHAT